MKRIYKDITGNYIFVTVKIMDKEFLIVSLYGPNRDNTEFYVELEERISEVGFENPIIGGEWKYKFVDVILSYQHIYLNYQNSH